MGLNRTTLDDQVLSISNAQPHYPGSPQSRPRVHRSKAPVRIFDAEWCLDIDDESDPDHKARLAVRAQGASSTGIPSRRSAAGIRRVHGRRSGCSVHDTPKRPAPLTSRRMSATPKRPQPSSSASCRGTRPFQAEFDEQCVDKFDRRLAYVFITVEVDDPLREIESYDGLVEEVDGTVEVLVE